MNNCVFCKIVKGEIPASKVYEDEKYLVFLSTSPINPGHTLVVPKRHINYFFDLEDEELGEIMAVAKKVAKAMKPAFKPKTGRIGVIVAGQGVPHVHVHLIPMHSEGDLSFERQKPNTPKEEIESNAQKIRQALQGKS